MQTMISGIAVGVILLQTAIFAPTIFTTIDKEPAGKLLRALFPKFFMFLALLGACTLFMSLFSSQSTSWHWVIGATTLLLAMVCLLLIPATNRATDQENTSRFKLLHSLSVLFTLLILIANIAMPFVGASST